MPPAEPLLMVLWIIAAALVVILLLVLRNTAQLSRLARLQQRLADKLATAAPARRRAPPAEPQLSAAPAPKPAPPPAAAAAAAPIEPITVRTDPDLGVVYSFRGKDYLSRIAADQARWRALNQADGTAHARAETIDGPVQRGHG